MIGCLTLSCNDSSYTQVQIPNLSPLTATVTPLYIFPYHECNSLFCMMISYGESTFTQGIPLVSSIPMLAMKVDTLFISKYGFISTGHMGWPITTTKNISLFAVYVTQIAKGYNRNVYIDQIDGGTLSQKELDTKMYRRIDFSPTLLTIVTWVDKDTYGKIENIFQCVIVSNDKYSYFVYNYGKLKPSSGGVGFTNKNCAGGINILKNVTARNLNHRSETYTIKERCNDNVSIPVESTLDANWRLVVLISLLIFISLGCMFSFYRLWYCCAQNNQTVDCNPLNIEMIPLSIIDIHKRRFSIQDEKIMQLNAPNQRRRKSV